MTDTLVKRQIESVGKDVEMTLFNQKVTTSLEPLMHALQLSIPRDELGVWLYRHFELEILPLIENLEIGFFEEAIFAESQILTKKHRQGALNSNRRFLIKRLKDLYIILAECQFSLQAKNDVPTPNKFIIEVASLLCDEIKYIVSLLEAIDGNASLQAILEMYFPAPKEEDCLCINFVEQDDAAQQFACKPIRHPWDIRLKHKEECPWATATRFNRN